VYLASKNGYQDSVLPTGHTAGAPEDALEAHPKPVRQLNTPAPRCARRFV
jgi:hypothetical protein